LFKTEKNSTVNLGEPKPVIYKAIYYNISISIFNLVNYRVHLMIFMQMLRHLKMPKH